MHQYQLLFLEMSYRRNQRIWECITEWPNRAFNLPALGERHSNTSITEICMQHKQHSGRGLVCCAVLAVIATLFLVLLLQRPSSSAVALPEAATATDADISPEGTHHHFLLGEEDADDCSCMTRWACHLLAGRIQVDLGMNFDYRGKPRRVECSHGAVAADHGRCSDIGGILSCGHNTCQAP